MRANMPYNIKDSAWAAERDQGQGIRHNQAQDSAQKLSPNSILVRPQALFSIPQSESTVPMTDEVATYQSIDNWEHSSIGALGPSHGTDDAGATPPTLPHSLEDSIHDGRFPRLSSVEYGVAGRPAQSAKSKPEMEKTESTVATSSIVRQSGIDWDDDEDSLVSSNFTKYSSEIGRNSYRDRFADY
jgi:hypothetical protein